MKKPFVVTDKDGNKIYDSDLVQEAIEKLGKNITYKKPIRREGSGRPKGLKNKITFKKYIYIRDKYYFCKKNSYGHTLDEISSLIRSELIKDKPEWWTSEIYTLNTIKDVIKKRKWGE